MARVLRGDRTRKPQKKMVRKHLINHGQLVAILNGNMNLSLHPDTKEDENEQVTFIRDDGSVASFSMRHFIKDPEGMKRWLRQHDIHHRNSLERRQNAERGPNEKDRGPPVIE